MLLSAALQATTATPDMKYIALLLSLFSVGVALPSYNPLYGFSGSKLDTVISTPHFGEPESPPGPLSDPSTKLVNDEAHPWKPLRPFDIRGPCPALNTLASHGYLPRNGIATPAQIINAVQEGFNMNNALAIFLAYAALLVDGNPITNQLSIGGKTPLTGPDPPGRAIIGGLNTPGLFEGDASLTRDDAFFGNNHDFNATLFEQFTDFCNRFGEGKYNLTVAAEYRYHRIQDCIATNPEFSLVAPRYIIAYADAVLPINFFVDGRKNDGQLDINDARGFFQFSRMPDGFFRPNGPKGGEGMTEIASVHPVPAGRNVGKVNSYTLDPSSGDLGSFCLQYETFVNETVGLYPNPTGILRKALNRNLGFLFLGTSGCSQLFPYGRD